MENGSRIVTKRLLAKYKKTIRNEKSALDESQTLNQSINSDVENFIKEDQKRMKTMMIINKKLIIMDNKIVRNALLSVGALALTLGLYKSCRVVKKKYSKNQWTDLIQKLNELIATKFSNNPV